MTTENEVVDDLDPSDAEFEGADIGDDIEVVVDESDESDEPAAEEVAAEPEAEAVAEDAVPEDDEDAADAVAMEGASEKTKKRFLREKRLRQEIIAERDRVRDVAIRVAKLAKERDDELVAVKKQNAVIQRQFAETLDYAYDKDIALKAAEVRKAQEAGDFDAELKAKGDLDTLRYQQNQVRQAKASLPDPEKVTSAAPQPQPNAAAQPAAPAQRPAPAPLAVKWLGANKVWFNNPKFEAHKDFVLSVDKKLIREGYDPKSTDYYTELDARIDAAFPTLRKSAAVVRSPVAPAGNAPASNRSRKTITLTRADLANMRRFGLDTANKEVLREYARNKRPAAA
jgi:hypothetical protein